MSNNGLREYSDSQTLTRIKEIIKQNNILVKEVVGTEISPGYYYVHLHLENGNLWKQGLVFNGRGLNYQQALISAYGELLERIQTMLIFEKRFVFSHIIAEELSFTPPYYLPFLYAPDEKVNKSESDTEVYLPFYHFNSKEIVNLPYRSIEFQCGSNGTAAGSTLKEACLHAVLEIYERYALRLLYTQRLTPPSIPVDSFLPNNEIQKALSFCRDNNLWIDIKDCNCGIGLPVIGVLIQHKDNKSYFFSLAASTDRDTALLHALSEAFQGNRWQSMQPYDEAILERVENDNIENDNERVKYSYGKHALYSSFFGASPSFELLIWAKEWASNIDTGLSSMFNLAKRLEKDIYIRDVSFLGFPTAIVYIPSMSETIDFDDNRWRRNVYGSKERIAILSNSIPSLSEGQIEKLLLLQSSYVSPITSQLFSSADAFSTENTSFVLGILAMSIDREELAKHFLQPLVTTPIGEKDLEYLKTKTDDFMQLYKFADCFHCSYCSIARECCIKAYYGFLLKIEETYLRNTPSQMLSGVFHASC